MRHDQSDRPRAKGPRYVPIPRVAGLNAREFEATYAMTNHPVILESFDRVANWEVFSDWRFSRLKEQFGATTISPRVNYPNPDHWWINPFETLPRDFPQFKKMTVSEFIDLANDPASRENPVYWRNRGPDAGADETFKPFFDGVHYDQIVSGDHDIHVELLIGSAGTRAGFHQDDRHNFLVHVSGRKQVFLGSPYYTRCFYPFAGLPEKSPIAPDYPNEKYPLFSEATIVTGTIGPGEVLWIPRGWWHALIALEPTIMLGCFYGEPLTQRDMEHMYSQLGPSYRIRARFQFVWRFIRSSMNILLGRSPIDGLTVWWTPGSAAAVSFFNRAAREVRRVVSLITGRPMPEKDWIPTPFF